MVLAQEFQAEDDADSKQPPATQTEPVRRHAKWRWPAPGAWPFWTSSQELDPADEPPAVTGGKLQHKLLESCGFVVEQWYSIALLADAFPLKLLTSLANSSIGIAYT